MLSYTYILSDKPRGTLYIGVTSDLIKRIWQHKESFVDGFSAKYGLKKLVWFEVHEDISEAIKREKQLKKWNRVWKIELVEKTNSEWRDLYPELLN
ncbi:GIY-YIG nuclease family protein [Undibacterium baiyunense]|uniref:GIY-YIG nuclease family protein n=1 Tax=Undibacterium baiyunense TaxID=2828731 RepID=A0A941I2G7_9BURK|nr:GIY-YIG nuclease family protein [Undibacterium baiyunense]MBR7746302.1 GIY-YIG nuclease family protein [Undibacterium baiyunense]